MRLKKLITICLAFILAINILPVFSLNVDAAANSITVPDATYYESGAIKSLTTNFNWDTGTATVRMALMSNRLRSAGEEGTSFSYGDFTNFGYYRNEFADFQAVLDHDATNHTFGILSYSGEMTPTTNSKNNQLVFNLAENAISLDTDATYYVYLWTQYGSQCYPDNLLLAINVQDGVVNYTPATGRNEYDTNAFVKVVAQEKYDVMVTRADNMTKTSGTESQVDLGVPMEPVVYTANTGYYFPDTYTVASVNGIKVTRDSETQITVSGMPTADTQITLSAAVRKVLPLDEMVFTYAYDVQRNPAFPAKGDNIRMLGLQKPYLANGTQGTTSEGNWTLTPIGTYALIKVGEKDSNKLEGVVMDVASQYPGLDSDTIVLHELKDGDTHIAYGVTVAYNQADGMAVFLGDNLAGGAGYLLSVEVKSGTVYTDATEILTDWVAPSVYNIVVDDSANGTTAVSANKAVAGEKITIIATPKQGYHVASVKYNDGEEHDVPLTGEEYSFTMPEKNVTVKATYVINTYTVTYKADDKIVETQTVEYGKDATPPKIPAKDGYTASWDKDGKNIMADTIIKAVYKANPVTNNHTSNGGETTKVPQTGDANQIFIWFALAIGSCVIYKFVLEMERNKKRIRRR